jgi:DNA-binding response OmpR family regulator
VIVVDPVARILVADADEVERASLRDLFAGDRHFVTVASNSTELLEAARRESPHLVIVADGLATGQALASLKRGDRGRSARVIVLSNPATEDERVEAFEDGADDWVTRPYSTRELVLRVRAVIGRTANDYAEVGSVRIDRGARLVWVGEELVPLVAIEFELLDRLMQRAGYVVLRRELAESIWGVDASRDTQTPIERHVQRLVEKLGSAGDRIESVFGVGFRFRVQP